MDTVRPRGLPKRARGVAAFLGVNAVVIGLAATVTAIFAARIWLVVAAIAGACALLLQLWPGRVMIISQAGLALFAVTLALGAWRAGRRRSQQLDALATDHREDRADLP